MKLLITELDNVLCTENGVLHEDAMDFLRGAHEKLFTIVLTNHPLKSTEERIKNFGISEYIDFVVSATEYEMPKPDHRMINVLLALLNTEGKKFDKSDVVIVGDRPSIDIKLGNKAGVQAIRIRRGRFASEEPEYPEEIAKIEVKNLAELAASLGVQMKREEPAKETLKSDLSHDFDVGAEIAEPAADAHKVSKSRPRRKAAKRARKKPEKKKGRFSFFGI